MLNKIISIIILCFIIIGISQIKSESIIKVIDKNMSNTIKINIPKIKFKNRYQYSKKYDSDFKKYSKRYFGPGFDYKWFKAQSIAESNLDPFAESPVGAKGLMQIMPATAIEIQNEQPWILNPFETRWNIASGIYYDKKLYTQWSAPRPFKDRMSFTLASYNCGLGNVLKAQNLCIKENKLNPNLWINIIKYANKISTWKHKETLAYVTKIHNLYLKCDQ